MYVDEIDEVILIGSGLVKESYLNEDFILDIVKKIGVEVIYLGYGFLSENVEFVCCC